MSEPAFPTFDQWGKPPEGNGGMSLRDCFAAKAMQGFLSRPDEHGVAAFQNPGWCARWSYELADAMLTERSKTK